jgi:hypothetical protein
MSHRDTLQTCFKRGAYLYAYIPILGVGGYYRPGRCFRCAVLIWCITPAARQKYHNIKNMNGKSASLQGRQLVTSKLSPAPFLITNRIDGASGLNLYRYLKDWPNKFRQQNLIPL